MNFTLSVEDFTIILNALHYYKKVEKQGHFQAYDDERINALRDSLANQLTSQNLS
jgi:non-homologous end joining protein Ku